MRARSVTVPLWFVLLVVVCPIAAAQSPPPPPPGAAGPPRFVARKPELARAYIEMERAVLAKADTLDPKTLDAVNRGFDHAADFYFVGDFPAAIRDIDRQLERVLGTLPWVRSLTVRASAPVVRTGRSETTTLSIAPACLWDRPERCEVGVALTTGELGDAPSTPVGTVVLGPDGRGEITVPLESEKSTRWRVVLYNAQRPEERAPCCWVYSTKDSLDPLRRTLLKRLEGLDADHPELGPALAACRSRARMLTDHPSPNNTYLLNNSLVALAQAAEREVLELAAGRDPYRHAEGDFWLTLRIGAADEPCRLLAPPVRPGEDPAKARPLVIAVHGAGGDENLWMDGYGVGILPREATKRNMLVLSVRVDLGTFMPATLDGLIDGVARWHEVDRSRVYVIGHSLGGGVVTAWAKQRADRIAGACSIAGIGIFGGTRRIAPTLAYAGERDGLITPTRIRASVEAARAAGLPVEFREVPNYGHLLLVEKVTPNALDWLLQHRLDANAPQHPASATEPKRSDPADRPPAEAGGEERPD